MSQSRNKTNPELNDPHVWTVGRIGTCHLLHVMSSSVRFPFLISTLWRYHPCLWTLLLLMISSVHILVLCYSYVNQVLYSKIPWYPKLLFQRENALASFWVQRVFVTQPRPSRVMIKHNILLWGIIELKLNPRRRVYVEIPKPSRVSLKLRQNPWLMPRVLTTF
jgi:hypothetical protein